MTDCTAGCGREARMALRTTRPTRAALQTTVFYDDRAAPKTAQPYCRECGTAVVLGSLTLVDADAPREPEQAASGQQPT